MTRRGEIATAIAAVAALWAGLAYNLSRPVDDAGYRRTLLQVAESAHDAVQTGRLTGEQELNGKVTSPFAEAAFDDASRGLAGAQQKFAGQGPPGPSSAALRDRLAPMLTAAVIALGDSAEAADDAALRSGVRRLGALAQQLDDFITAQQS